MSTLHVFGDSFAEDFSTSWTRTIANLQGLDVCNYAKGGTSLEWSALKFTRAKFNSGDVVLFVMTNSNRFDVEPYVTKTPTDSYKAKDADSLDSNLLWYVKSRSQELLDLKPTLYTSLIHSTSVVNPNVKFVVIAGFPDSKNTSIIKQTSNFIVLDQTSLNEISHYEVNEIKLNPYMLYNVCGNDPRINHLSNINLDNLANCVNSSITNWDSSQFKLSKFVKNVINKKITSMEELHTYYVETGLFNKDWVNLVTQPTKTFRKTFLDIFRV